MEKINELINKISKCNELKYNLSLRSKNIPASSFTQDNPEYADGVPILARTKVTKSDPNIKVSYNNFAVIQKNKAGYMGGNIKREFSKDIKDDLKEKYKEFDNLNKVKSLFKKMMFSCVGWGNTFSLCYLDEQKRIRMKQIQAWNAKVIYDMNDEPVKGYVYYTDDKIHKVFEYDLINVTEYEKRENTAEYVVKQTNPHGFNGLPLIEWINNDNRQGNAQIAVSLLDAFDRLMSDNITEWATFRNAYLMLKNIGLVNEETKEQLQKTGIFAIQGDNSEIKFITKDINPEFVKFITEKTWAGIWVVSSSVDPMAVASLQNATAFQIAQLYRNMEQDCMDTEMEWKISLEYLDRLLYSYWTGLDLKTVADYSTEEIHYEFERNIPKDVMTWLKDLIAAGGKLPNAKILEEAGYEEEEAQELADKAIAESYDEMPALDGAI